MSDAQRDDTSPELRPSTNRPAVAYYYRAYQSLDTHLWGAMVFHYVSPPWMKGQRIALTDYQTQPVYATYREAQASLVPVILDMPEMGLEFPQWLPPIDADGTTLNVEPPAMPDKVYEVQPDVE